MNISGQSLVPFSRSTGPAVRPFQGGEGSRVRRIEGEILPAQGEMARTNGGRDSRITPSGDADTLTRRMASSSADIGVRALDVLPGRGDADDLPPAMRKALSTYVYNENLTRLDANADFLGRVDAWA